MMKLLIPNAIRRIATLCTSISVLVVTVSGCVTFRHNPNQGQVFIGSQFQGGGLYLCYPTESTTSNEPNLVVSADETNITVEIMLANGYPSQVLIRKQDDVVLRMHSVEVHDVAGNSMGRSGFGKGLYCPDHPTYERLQGNHGSYSNRIAVNTTTTTIYRQPFSLSFQDNPERYLNWDETGDHLVLPARTSYADVEYILHLEYVVLDRAGWYRTDVPIRLRVLRNLTGQPGVGALDHAKARRATSDDIVVKIQ